MLISFSFSNHDNEANENEVPVITKQPKMNKKMWVSQIEPSQVVVKETFSEMLGEKEISRIVNSPTSSSMPHLLRNLTIHDNRKSIPCTNTMTESKGTGKYCDKF